MRYFYQDDVRVVERRRAPDESTSVAQPEEEVDEMKKMKKNVGQESNALKRPAGTQLPIRVKRSVRTINWNNDNPRGLALIKAAVERFGASKKAQYI